MKLYEINEEILNCVDEETGEITDFERFNNLQIERDEKIENIALWYKNLSADAIAYKAEKDAFAEKEKSAKNKADSLKKYLDSVLSGNTFKTTKVNVTYRKSQAVEIIDINKLNENYIKYAEPTADKARIKEDIKNGVDVDGAMIVDNQNIQIK